MRVIVSVCASVHVRVSSWALFSLGVRVVPCVSQDGGVRADGRKLNMVLAVSREDASKLKNKKVKTQKGSRNLYLAREGCKCSQ